MNLQENGPLQKANRQLSDPGDTWKISKSALIGFLLLTLAAGALCYMAWENNSRGRIRNEPRIYFY